MGLTGADVVRHETFTESVEDKVDFIVYIYDEHICQNLHFQSINELLSFLNAKPEDNTELKAKHVWIEVIHQSCSGIRESIQLLCEHFNIHPLTMEDITTLSPYMKLDLFRDSGALYLSMIMLTWNDHSIRQQQISFYLNCSRNLLITFQEKSEDDDEPYFQMIRQRLQRRQSKCSVDEYSQNRLRLLNTDYLFYCLLEDIVDRYMYVVEEIAVRIDRLDAILMDNERSRTLATVHSIYLLKHDLLHVRILLHPLREIMNRLQRAISDDDDVSYTRKELSIRLGLKHRIIRRKARPSQPMLRRAIIRTRSKSFYLNDYMHFYLNDLNNHVHHVIDSLEVQRESVEVLRSFWNTLTNNQTQITLQFLMMITVVCVPCSFLVAINSTNFRSQPHLTYKYGYFIVWCGIGLIVICMLLWYKAKRWI